MAKLAILAVLTAFSISGGCGQLLGFGGGDADIQVQSLDHGAVYAPTLPTVIYKAADENEADVLMTDMPVSRLADPADDLADLSGNLIHVRMFLVPQAGMTPVDRTACNGTVRHVIVVGGAAGVYVGGGFIVPHDEPGSDSFSASAKNVSVRLARAGAGFADRLGPGMFTGSFTARLDERTAGALLERLGSIERSTRAVDRKKE